jgi:hypothetical protein
LLFAAAAARSQSLEIYSEFQRPDPFGSIVPADRGWRPREILSPAVARNGHVSFHVAVTVPQGEAYQLFVAMNPADACLVTLYSERFVHTPDGWIPDTLLELPRGNDSGTVPDPNQKIEGQTTRVYLLDVWIPADAPVRRFRLEMQLKTADWIIRPLEFRVTEARYPAPGATGRPANLPPPERGADDAALAAFLAPQSAPATRPATVREIIHRNALQDTAVAAARDQNLLHRAIGLFGLTAAYRPWGAEWVLQLR